MKIIVIGAGIGGLEAATELSRGGIEVTVFERGNRSDISYDWIDDVETGVFNELDIPIAKLNPFRTANVSFAAPFSDKLLRVELDEEKLDWSIERRPFSELLIERARNVGVSICFNSQVDRLLVENGKVCGVIVKGEEIRADLVVDSSGVFSEFRASLPTEYLIPKQPNGNEVFFAYRGFFAPRKGEEPPKKHTKKIYLKHLGEDGIAWCIIEPNGEVNVLVGRTNALDENTLEKAMEHLREDNPIIGEELLRGGIIRAIPIRYPSTKMVGYGYCNIGDSAFMTIPMIGSGIANSLRAGNILAQTILSEKSVGIDTLWHYQYKYYTKIGASHFPVDILKRALLGAKSEDIRFLFESGIIGEAEMTSIGSGEELRLSFSQILEKLKSGRKNLGVLVIIVKAVIKGSKAEKLARKIPQAYDTTAIEKWRKKLDGLFG